MDLCAPGWTESTVPVFHYSAPGASTLQIRATTEAGDELTAEIHLVIEYPQ